MNRATQPCPTCDHGHRPQCSERCRCSYVEFVAGKLTLCSCYSCACGSCRRVVVEFVQARRPAALVGGAHA